MTAQKGFRRNPNFDQEEEAEKQLGDAWRVLDAFRAQRLAWSLLWKNLSKTRSLEHFLNKSLPLLIPLLLLWLLGIRLMSLTCTALMVCCRVHSKMAHSQGTWTARPWVFMFGNLAKLSLKEQPWRFIPWSLEFSPDDPTSGAWSDLRCLFLQCFGDVWWGRI